MEKLNEKIKSIGDIWNITKCSNYMKQECQRAENGKAIFKF